MAPWPPARVGTALGRGPARCGHPEVLSADIAQARNRNVIFPRQPMPKSSGSMASWPPRLATSVLKRTPRMIASKRTLSRWGSSALPVRHARLGGTSNFALLTPTRRCGTGRSVACRAVWVFLAGRFFPFGVVGGFFPRRYFRYSRSFGGSPWSFLVRVVSFPWARFFFCRGSCTNTVGDLIGISREWELMCIRMDKIMVMLMGGHHGGF